MTSLFRIVAQAFDAPIMCMEHLATK